MKKSRKNFVTPLHKACSKIDSKTNCIYFDDGYAVATNGYLLVRQSLKLHGFTDDEIKQMNGKGINYELFKTIYKADFVVVEDGIIKFDDDEFPLQNIDDFPNYKSILPKYYDKVKLDRFKIDLKYLKLVRKLSFENKGFDIFFPSERNILIRSEVLTFDDELFLLMLKI